MGDVVALYTPYGTQVGTYSYDPYGRITQIKHNDNYKDIDGILEKNPFRYRSYYFDTETGWYYLNSRYYDPEIKRFINGDSTQLLTNTPDNLMQYNLFMYCDGDPVDKIDPYGMFSLEGIIHPIYFIGVSSSFGAGMGVVFGKQIVIDTAALYSNPKHIIGTQEYVNAGAVVGEQAAISVSVGSVYTTNIKNTEGYSDILGLDVDSIEGAGADLIVGGSVINSDFFLGLSVSYDVIGEGVDVHDYVGITGETEYTFENVDKYLLVFLCEVLDRYR